MKLFLFVFEIHKNRTLFDELPIRILLLCHVRTKKFNFFVSLPGHGLLAWEWNKIHLIETFHLMLPFTSELPWKLTPDPLFALLWKMVGQELINETSDINFRFSFLSLVIFMFLTEPQSFQKSLKLFWYVQSNIRLSYFSSNKPKSIRSSVQEIWTTETPVNIFDLLQTILLQSQANPMCVLWKFIGYFFEKKKLSWFFVFRFFFFSSVPLSFEKKKGQKLFFLLFLF